MEESDEEEEGEQREGEGRRRGKGRQGEEGGIVREVVKCEPRVGWPEVQEIIAPVEAYEEEEHAHTDTAQHADTQTKPDSNAHPLATSTANGETAGIV